MRQIDDADDIVHRAFITACLFVWALLVLAGRMLISIVRGIARAIIQSFYWVLGVVLRVYVYYFVQADSCAKCPSCGIRREHDVRWSDSVNALIHVCKRCFAVWTEKPMVKAEAWSTRLVAMEEEDGGTGNGSAGSKDRDGVRTTTIQHAQREPQLEYMPTGRNKPVVLRMKGGAA